MPTRIASVWPAGIALAGIALLVACGGGIATTPLSGSVGAPSVVATATASPFSVAGTVMLPVPGSTDAAATPIPLALPSSNGTSTELDIPADAAAISPGTSISALVTNALTGDVPALGLHLRGAQQLAPQATAPKNILLEVQLVFSQTIVLVAEPSFIIIFPPGIIKVDTSYYLAFYDASDPGQGWVAPYEGPAQVFGTSILVLIGNDVRTTYKRGVVYTFALYSVSGAATPAPSPSPTAAPTPTPSPIRTTGPTPGPLSVAPNVINFDASGQTETLTASRTNFSGTFAAVANSTLVTVQQSSATTFQVTAGSAPCANCSVTVSDSSGASVSIPVTITITTGSIH